jgi:hypothetical protein
MLLTVAEGPEVSELKSLGNALDWRVTGKDGRETEGLKTGTVESLPDDKIFKSSPKEPATTSTLEPST